MLPVYKKQTPGNLPAIPEMPSGLASCRRNTHPVGVVIDQLLPKPFRSRHAHHVFPFVIAPGGPVALRVLLPHHPARSVATGGVTLSRAPG